MASPSSAPHEPTMEEILASIRKIISEDSPEPPPAPVSVQAETKAPPEPDVLELTQEVHEEPATAPVAPPPTMSVAAAPVRKPVDDVVFEAMEEPSVSTPSPAPSHSGDGIFSDKARKALDDAFTGLEPAVPAEPEAAGVPGMSGLPLEALFERAVRNAFEPVLQKWLSDNAESIIARMKPSISEWLDEHFPAMLEDAVRNEVGRAAKARTRR